jgi:hypothetical protein
MFVSIVGHAIFQTAWRSGPSTMDRSYRPAAGPGEDGVGEVDAVSSPAGAVTSVKWPGYGV